MTRGNGIRAVGAAAFFAMVLTAPLMADSGLENLWTHSGQGLGQLQARAHQAVKAARSIGKKGQTSGVESAAVDGVTLLGPDSNLSCAWVKSRAEIHPGDWTSPMEARALAIRQAEAKAIRYFLGSEVQTSYLKIRTQTSVKEFSRDIQNMVHITQKGRIIDEKVLKSGYLPLPDCPQCVYAAVIKDCLKSAPSKDDLSVRLRLSRNTCHEGDAITITATASQNSYLYLFDISAGDNKAELLAPNDITPLVSIEAGQSWVFPDSAARDQGLVLRADLPKGQSRSVEILKVLAVSQPLTSLESTNYWSIIRGLNKMGVAWSDDTQIAVISKDSALDH